MNVVPFVCSIYSNKILSLLYQRTSTMRITTGPLLLQFRRHLTTNAPRSSHILITTPIFYVNAQPHVGHLHSALLADAAARWHRTTGKHVMFTTGTDEHGLKVQEAAEAKGQAPREFCDQVSQSFNHCFDAANIQYDRFVRTFALIGMWILGTISNSWHASRWPKEVRNATTAWRQGHDLFAECSCSSTTTTMRYGA